MRERANEKKEIWDRAYDAPPCPAGVAEQARECEPATAGEVRAGAARNFPIRLVRRAGREYELVLSRSTASR